MSDRTADILDAASTGRRLPPGDFDFQPPLVFTDSPGLRGTPGRTILRPLSVASVGQPLLQITTTQPGDISGLPRRSVFQDLRILGTGQGYGILSQGAMIRYERVDVIDCYHGMTFNWSVDVNLTDCILRHNVANVYVNVPGPIATTTIRFRQCQIREAMYAGVIVDSGWGITLDDCVVESNAYCGLDVRPAAHSVRLNNVWMENNPTNVIDPAGRVQYGYIPHQ